MYLLVDPKLERLGHHFVRLELGQRKRLTAPEPHAVDAKRRLHPVVDAGPIPELLQLEGDVEGDRDAGRLEVQHEEARSGVVVEQDALGFARGLPARDDLLDPQRGAPGDADLLEQAVAARRRPRHQQDVVGVCPAGGRASRAGVEAAPVGRVDAGDLRRPVVRRAGERERPRRLARSFRPQQHRDIRRLAADEGHGRGCRPAVDQHRRRRTLRRQSSRTPRRASSPEPASSCRAREAPSGQGARTRPWTRPTPRQSSGRGAARRCPPARCRLRRPRGA